MNSLYDTVSEKISALIIKEYSTSFSNASSLLHPSVRKNIYAIYAFVRYADEIVDSFEDHNQEALLNDFIENYQNALKHKISLNPILHAFQKVVNTYQLQDMVVPFLTSMKADLSKKNYDSQEEYERYIYGSADVVGLMCLKVFTADNHGLYKSIESYAKQLGSAFQKVNFLRDFKDDNLRLKRSYFPNISGKETLNASQKANIIKDIEQDFRGGLVGIKRLPKNSKLAVYVAYNYYWQLLKKLKRTTHSNIGKSRIRISNSHKFFILTWSYIKYTLNLI